MDGELSPLATRLIAHKERWDELESASGVPYHTFRKIAYGQTKNPRMQTVDPLRDTLDQWDQQRSRRRRTD